jgi:hypothetical protein
MGSDNNSDSKRFTRDEAREALPEELRATFDILCEDTIAWSRFIYGKKLVSYSILMRLVEGGWIKQKSR